MYVTPEEIFTHLYEEQITAIQGDDERMLQMAVDGAIVEAKGYLHKYDLAKIFSETGDNRNPLLCIFIKDIAVWHYINIANPNIDFSIREKRYNATIAWLKGVQKGDIVPELPIPTDEEGNKENTTGFRFGSNPKRENYI